MRTPLCLESNFRSLSRLTHDEAETQVFNTVGSSSTRQDVRSVAACQRARSRDDDSMADEVAASPPEAPEVSEEPVAEIGDADVEPAAQSENAAEVPEVSGVALEASSVASPEGGGALAQAAEDVAEASSEPTAGAGEAVKASSEPTAGGTEVQEAENNAPEASGDSVPAEKLPPTTEIASEPPTAEAPAAEAPATEAPQAEAAEVITSEANVAAEAPATEAPQAEAAEVITSEANVAAEAPATEAPQAEAAEVNTSEANAALVEQGRLNELHEALADLAVRVVELFIEWDEDGNGATDKREFMLALPVLGLFASQEEANALFDKVTGNAEMIEHWTLFRNLVGTTEGVDVKAAEATARKHIQEIQTKSKLGESAFWQRETGGKSVNKHALRKRDGSLRTWNKQTGDANMNFMNSLGNRNDSPTFDFEAAEGVNARQLQGTSVLNPNASLEEQLLHALDEHMARIIGEQTGPTLRFATLFFCAAYACDPHHANTLPARRTLPRMGRGWRWIRFQARVSTWIAAVRPEGRYFGVQQAVQQVRQGWRRQGGVP